MSPIPLGILALAGAAGGAPAYDLLETTTLTSSASSVSFTGLNAYSDYKHLQIRAVVQNATDVPFYLQINGDTGSNYAWHRLRATGSSVSSLNGSNQPRIDFGPATVTSFNSSAYNATIIDLLDYSSSSKNSTVRFMNGYISSSGEKQLNFGSGLWNNTSAVTSLLFYGNTFVSGTRFSLYGVRG